VRRFMSFRCVRQIDVGIRRFSRGDVSAADFRSTVVIGWQLSVVLLGVHGHRCTEIGERRTRLGLGRYLARHARRGHLVDGGHLGRRIRVFCLDGGRLDIRRRGELLRGRRGALEEKSNVCSCSRWEHRPFACCLLAASTPHV
jgi:hypothetical protein